MEYAYAMDNSELAWLFGQNISLGCCPVFVAISAPDEFIVTYKPLVCSDVIEFDMLV